MSKTNTLRRSPRQLRSTAVYVHHWRRVHCDDWLLHIMLLYALDVVFAPFLASFPLDKIALLPDAAGPFFPLLIPHTTRKNCVLRLATCIPYSKGHLQRFFSAPCIFSEHECAYRFACYCLFGRAQPFCCSVHKKKNKIRFNAAWECGAYGSTCSYFGLQIPRTETIQLPGYAPLINTSLSPSLHVFFACAVSVCCVYASEDRCSPLFLIRVDVKNEHASTIATAVAFYRGLCSPLAKGSLR